MPVPTVGDQLTIRDQLWEIVEVNPDDRGELAFRLIREELGLTFAELSPIAAVSIYVWSDAAQGHGLKPALIEFESEGRRRGAAAS